MLERTWILFVVITTTSLNLLHHFGIFDGSNVGVFSQTRSWCDFLSFVNHQLTLDLLVFSNDSTGGRSGSGRCRPAGSRC